MTALKITCMASATLKFLVLSLAGIGTVFSPSHAAEYSVASAAEIAHISNELHPGDVLVMAEGNWNDQAIIFRGHGTVDKPITLRAATAGKTVLRGRSSITVDGEYLVVSGLCLKDQSITGDGVALKGNHCRLTETAVVGGTSKFFVHVSGAENRVDHCYLAGKTSESPTLQIEVEDKPNHHLIDHNYFGPRPPLGKNGGETIRVGYSGQSMRNSRSLVEQNFFEQCDGEIEIISNKSCENVYRSNTFLNCAGMLTLRHGNRCRVEGNFFLGQHKKGSGGIRIIGEDHTIINNYIEGVTQGGFWITAGIPDSPLNGYFQAKNVLIAFNTVVNSRGPYLDLDAGFGTSNRSLKPQNITVVNNLFGLPPEGTLLKGTEGEGFQWLGNLASGTATVHPGIKIVDLKLEIAKDGLQRPTGDSPARGAAMGDFPLVKTDIDGQQRTGPVDVGCDQITDGPITNRPLSAQDVGPSWMTVGRP